MTIIWLTATQLALLLGASSVYAGTEEIEVTVSSVEGGGGGDASPPDPCRWRNVAAGEKTADVYNAVHTIMWTITSVLAGSTKEITVVYYSENNTLHRHDSASGVFEYQRVFKCDPGGVRQETDPAIDTYDWVPVPDPDPAILLVRTRIGYETIKAPVPAISPVPEAGVPVNFGIWFAVDDAGPYVARAAFNDRVWAQRTATLVETSFDPGNGSKPIVCPGHGTPIPDSEKDSADPSPTCGYTYTEYDDVTGDINITMTMRWQIRWDLSDGRFGYDDDLYTSTSIPYDVYEIQTVGNSG
jgi:hypothetical protein